MNLSGTKTLRRVGIMIALAAGCAVEAAVPIKVDGLGWLENRGMRIALERLTNARAVDQLASNAVEDAAVILHSSLLQQGFQNPSIEIAVQGADGTGGRFTFDPTFSKPIPRGLAAHEVTFFVKPGVRWRIKDVRIEGLTVFPLEEGIAYFRSDAVLLNVAQANIYSKGRLNRSENALLEELRRRGFAEASVRADLAEVERRNGDVTVAVAVHEGPKWQIADVRIDSGAVEGVTLPDATQWREITWTPTVDQDIREAVRLAFYRGGYPDVAVNVTTAADREQGGVRRARLVVDIVPGERVTMGRPQFVGNHVTRESVLRRRVRSAPGEPLDVLALERARYRISRLGVFESVQLEYEPDDAPVRDPVFIVEEGERYETNLLFGWGSYEQLRGGVEYRQMNILGLAHQSRLLLVQSMKSSRAEYTYTIPEIFGELVDGSAKLFGLQRQEIAFLRQEYGATFSLRRRIARIHGDALVAYTFEALRNRKNVLSTFAVDEKQLNVASLNLALTTDRRDNALRPRRGYHAATQLEVASPSFGGVAEYQRFEISGAYHTPWGRGRWVHIGLSHGLLTTMGAHNDRELPVNKRFYPGGDNSIRGYQRGEAAPRDASGRFIGAKSYLLLNVEIEQALTRSWSVVAFADLLGNAVTLRQYPYGERLYSVGLGVRYQTIVGPVRLEYGRNVNRRAADPSGTWHLSLGYPF